MKSTWNDREAADFVARLGGDHGEEMALRVYTSQLLGRESRLVLHGGGNTSVKMRRPAVDGTEIDVLCVKGSGRNLAEVDVGSFPALDLDALLRLRSLSALDDLEMANQLRRAMLQTSGPTPSVEALLHAFLPHKFVDHTHADAVLELTNQPNGEELVREALGERVVVLPWVMPGFDLARAVATAYEAQPDCVAIAIAKHGVFTFADEVRECYEQMIEIVDRAEAFVAGRVAGSTMLDVPAAADDSEDWLLGALPVMRGALAASVETPLGPSWERVVTECRVGGDMAAFAAHADAAELVRRGPLTPDHVIRTRGEYLFLTREQAASSERVRAAVARYAEGYASYFEAHRGRRRADQAMLDPRPRIAVVEGLGLIAFAEDKQAAIIAADIAEHTVRAMARGQALGRYEPLGPEGVFDMEYWPLELAKLGKATRAVLEGQVAVVTGAGGAIGHGIADALLAAGSHVVVTDFDRERLEVVGADLASRHRGERVRSVCADVTSSEDVERIFATCQREFGGVDIVVPNAGIAHVSSLAEMDASAFQRVLDVNLTGTLHVLKLAAAIFEAQATGGSVVVQSSKNVFDPGAGFGAYSASKAGAHQLGKIAALEFAPLGVTVNMINADAVFGDASIKSGLWEQVGPDRMRARGLDPEGLRAYYRERSLLKKSVVPAHVGQAVVFFASGATPTTGATLPVDAGIPGAFPR